MSKKIYKQVSIDKLGKQFPSNTEVTVDHLCISVEKNYYSTTIKGTTNTNTYYTHNFGFGVSNHAKVPMRIQFTFLVEGEDEYSNEFKYAWEDVKAGKKKRIWANLDIKPKSPK